MISLREIAIYARSIVRMEPVVIVGPKWQGAFRMRGEAIAQRIGCRTCQSWRMPRCDTAIIVKDAVNSASHIRRKCNRLVYDMLDSWMAHESSQRQVGYIGSPETYFSVIYRKMQFDTLLVQTPAAMEVARSVLPPSVEVIFAPHHADPSIRTGWYNPNGPVVYVGGSGYIAARIQEIEDACSILKKRLVISSDLNALRNASIALALRLPPHDTPMNRLAKPQVKLENAVAAGLPILASHHACVLSCRPNTPTWDDKSGHSLVDALSAALSSRPLSNPVTIEDHCNLLRQILGAKLAGAN